MRHTRLAQARNSGRLPAKNPREAKRHARSVNQSNLLNRRACVGLSQEGPQGTMLTIRQMQIFRSVVEHGSFRACAEAVGISQVVVSSHIRELEKNLAVALFNRQAGHAATLTSSGERAHDRILALLADIQDMQDEIGGQINRRIRLVTFNYLFQKYQERLAQFEMKHPHIELKVDLDPPENAAVSSQINAGIADVACFFTCRS